MEENYANRVMTTLFFAVLILLSFFLLKPILMSIVIGILLAYIFHPIYKFIYKYVKSKDVSAGLICLLLILLVVMPFWFLTPIFIEQSLKVYVAAQQTDFIGILKSIFPSLFASETFSNEVGSIIHSFVTRTANKFVDGLAAFVLDFPTYFLQLTVIFFTFYFVMRDRDEMIEYIKSLLPFSKDVEKKLFQYSEGITSSVLYGQIVVGIIQGIIAGIGFFLFQVPNPLFLSLLAMLAGVFPIIGTALIWLPVVIYLVVAGNNFAATGVLVFGLISSSVDNFLRPMIVSRKTSIHSSVILIGMIGGIFMFGIMGLILGPLILAYLLIVIELYRKKKTPGVFIEGPVINPSK